MRFNWAALLSYKVVFFLKIYELKFCPHWKKFESGCHKKQVFNYFKQNEDVRIFGQKNLQVKIWSGFKYSNHLNTGFIWKPDSMGFKYSNSKVTWLGRPFHYLTISLPDHLTTGHKSNIQIQFSQIQKMINQSFQGCS